VTRLCRTRGGDSSRSPQSGVQGLVFRPVPRALRVLGSCPATFSASRSSIVLQNKISSDHSSIAISQSADCTVSGSKRPNC
jgi:hypothetical protein